MKSENNKPQSANIPVSDIAFTPSVKAFQTHMGSRENYEVMEQQGGWKVEIAPQLANFIDKMDTFFLGTVNAEGQPYIQHRGGPKGFLKMLDDSTLAFADFAGNKQYITLGNLDENDRASIFLMDYANRQRIKVWGRAEVVEDDAELLALVDDPDYATRPERAIVFHVDAWDTNCPKHIPVLLPADAVEQSLAKLNDRIAELERENAELRQSA